MAELYDSNMLNVHEYSLLLPETQELNVLVLIFS